MNFYKLSMDMTREDDVILHYNSEHKIELNTFQKGVYYDLREESIEFCYDEDEGKLWTDFLANDKGWFIVSEKLKTILNDVNSDIQFIEIYIVDKENAPVNKKYYIANILKVIDALCLEKSQYFETYIEGKGTIYTVSKNGIYEENSVEWNDAGRNGTADIVQFVCGRR